MTLLKMILKAIKSILTGRTGQEERANILAGLSKQQKLELYTSIEKGNSYECNGWIYNPTNCRTIK